MMAITTSSSMSVNAQRRESANVPGVFMLRQLSRLVESSPGFRHRVREGNITGEVGHLSETDPTRDRQGEIRGRQYFKTQARRAAQCELKLAVAPGCRCQGRRGNLPQAHVVQIPVAALQVGTDRGRELDADMPTRPGVASADGRHIHLAIYESGVVAENVGHVGQHRRRDMDPVAGRIAIIKAECKRHALLHPATRTDDSDLELVGFAGSVNGVERMRRSRIVPIHGFVILKQRDLRHGKQPDRLAAIAVLNMIGAAGRRVVECTNQLVPQESAVLDVPFGLGCLLPGINVDADEGVRL